MFKIKHVPTWNRTKKQMAIDIGYDLRDRMRESITNMGYPETTSNKMIFDEEELVVGSEAFSIAVMDSGRIPGEYPPFNKIADWVRYIKDDGDNADAPESMINKITWAVMDKIKYEGIDPSWFAKNVLEDFT